MEVGEKKLISLGYIKNLLKEIKKKRDLSYIEERTLKFLEQTYKLDEKEEKEILKDLEDIKLPEEVKMQILEILPKNEEQLRHVLYTNTLPKEDMEKILNILKKYE